MAQAKPPIVDPSPTQAPIQAGDNTYTFPPAAASDPDVLALKPNSVRDPGVVTGPHPQVSPTSYVRMSKPDGSEFLAPAANVDHYKAKGWVAGASVEIEDIGAYWAEKSKA